MIYEKIEYPLPRSAIAQEPVTPRDAALLLVLDRSTRSMTFSKVERLASFLDPDDLLVLNDSRVIPARLRCERANGVKAVLLVLRFDDDTARMEALVPGAKKISRGEMLRAPEGRILKVVQKGPGGRMHFQAEPPISWLEYLGRAGEAPLPPYIRRKSIDSQTKNRDLQRYQTVYAKLPGSIAAPTAGLHFTRELLEKISNKVQTTCLTLHVGEATFRGDAGTAPGEEEFSITAETASRIKSARRVVAVGTTVCRVLEHMAGQGGIRSEAKGSTGIVLSPGCVFKSTGGLMTNFHMPRSSPLALAAAFCGKDFLLEAYKKALEKGFRFASYGDSMLII